MFGGHLFLSFIANVQGEGVFYLVLGADDDKIYKLLLISDHLASSHASDF